MLLFICILVNRYKNFFVKLIPPNWMNLNYVSKIISSRENDHVSDMGNHVTN